MNDTHCLNCERAVEKTQNFCSNCGQQIAIHRFSIPHFIHEGFHAFTHADKGIIYLLKGLIVRPGVVAREYIAGKRKKYFNPFTFFLILAAFYVLSNGLKVSKADQNRPLPATIATINDPVKRDAAISRYQRVGKARDFTNKHGNLITMVAVPFFALFFWVVYYRKRYNYAEHLVASMMFVSLANLAFSLIVHPLQAVLKGHSIADFVPILGFILQWIYLIVAYKGLMQLNGFWAVFKLIWGCLLVLMLWIGLSLLVNAIYVYQNAHFLDFFKYMMGR